jgi:hypothetical protein
MIKTTLIFLFHKQGVIRKKLGPDGKIVNSEFYEYVQMLERLLKGISSEATILSERQLVPSAQQYPCSFYHNSEVLPGELQHGQIGHPSCSPDHMPDNFLFLQ